jgi:hypothetical protein
MTAGRTPGALGTRDLLEFGVGYPIRAWEERRCCSAVRAVGLMRGPVGSSSHPWAPLAAHRAPTIASSWFLPKFPSG